MHLLKNPFCFGTPVAGDFYLDRPNLVCEIKKFVKNRISTILIGPKEVGKSSFVFSLMQHLKKEGYVCFFVDISQITSHRDFLKELIKCIAAKTPTLEKVKCFLKDVNPKITWEIDSDEDSTNFFINLSLLRKEEVQQGIQDLLTSFSSFGSKVFVAFDELQNILEINDKGWLEATITQYIKKLDNVSFFFTGSSKMVARQAIDFPNFGPEFTVWLIDKFLTVNIQCKKEVMEYLRSVVKGSLNYVQMVCFYLVEQGKSEISTQDVQKNLKIIAKKNGYLYETLLNTLPLVQRRCLRLVANEKRHFFRKEFLSKFEMKGPSALYMSIKALKEKGILHQNSGELGNVFFKDPLLAFWINLNSKLQLTDIG